METIPFPLQETFGHISYRRLWRVVVPILLVICILLVGCQTTSPLPNETPEIPTKISIAVTKQVISTPSREPTFTIAPTTTPIPAFHIDAQCPEVAATLPDGIAQGAISYWGRNIDFNVLLNLENGQRSSLPDGSLAQAIVSQDQNKIAYSYHDPNDYGIYLVVHVLDEQKVIELPWPSSRSDLSRWQDNERLLFTDYSDDPPYTHRVLNPFTGETIFLTPDYPGLSRSRINWERAGSTVYDRTLEYVVYAAVDETNNNHTYVLWHIPSKTKIAALPGNSYGGFTADYTGYIPLDGVSYNPPVWSTDDTRVAVISSSPDDMKVDEIFAINKDGNIQQLTEFAVQFERANIRTLSWSPDGKQIAFFITTEPGALGTRRNEQLAILDTETSELTLYCLEGDTILTRAGMYIGDEQQTPAPLWSPDGSQLIIENRYAEDDSRLILLDIPSDKAYEIGQNIHPFGWMLSEPN